MQSVKGNFGIIFADAIIFENVIPMSGFERLFRQHSNENRRSPSNIWEAQDSVIPAYGRTRTMERGKIQDEKLEYLDNFLTHNSIGA